MSELECVRMKDASALMDQYLQSLVKEVGFSAKLLSWDKPTISLNKPLILIADQTHLKELKKIIDNRDEKIIIALNSRKDFKLVSELTSQFSKIFGFVDLSQEIEYNIPILKNYLSLNFTKHALKLEKLADDLDKVYEYTQSQLFQIKDLHDRFVKVRTDKLKGMTLTSKFMAGEKSGGEFFEIVQNDLEMLFIQAGSNSYLLSSMILSEIEMLKEKSSSHNLQKEAESFQKIISHHARENNAELTYCMMNLNLKTLEASFTLKGRGYIYFQGELLSFDKPMKLKLKPSDRLCVISEGAMNNWDALNPNLTTKKFFGSNKEMPTKELVNEFFFEVSRNKAGKFLIYDALMAVVDIEENALYQLS